MEIVIHEPNKFGWSPLFTGSASRNPTLTDVKFLSPTRCVAANRQGAKLYLIDISGSDHTIAHSIDVCFADKPYFPDLFVFHNGLLYSTHYDGNISVFEIKDSIIPLKLIPIGPDVRFHGITFHNGHIWTTVAQGKKHIYKIHPETHVFQKYVLKGNGDNSIKDITFIDANHFLILATSNTPDTKERYYDGFICLYKFTSGDVCVCLDAIKFKHTQFDSIIAKDGVFYATAHTALHGGRIIQGELSRSGGTLKIGEFKEMPAAGFPHGIDIYTNLIAYTSYSNSSVIITDRKKLNANVNKS